VRTSVDHGTAVHGDHQVEVTAPGAEEDGVRGERALDGDPVRRHRAQGEALKQAVALAPRR